MTAINILEEINQKIEEIYQDILTGKISLLDLELVPIFNQLEGSLNMEDLDKYSKSYINACGLLNQKFEELKGLLSSLNTQKKFMNYLNTNPRDEEISQLFDGCWRKIFTIDALSMEFLDTSQKRLSKKREISILIEHLQKEKADKDFILEVPKLKFTEKLENFLDSILDKLPCKFNDIFQDETDQIKIYEKFVYILHLLQLGKIKYQKDTKTIYI